MPPSTHLTLLPQLAPRACTSQKRWRQVSDALGAVSALRASASQSAAPLLHHSPSHAAPGTMQGIDLARTTPHDYQHREWQATTVCVRPQPGVVTCVWWICVMLSQAG